MRWAPIRRRAVLDARLAGGQLLAMQCELLVLVLGGLLEVRQSETASCVATTQCNKAICISFAGDAFLRTRTILHLSSLRSILPSTTISRRVLRRPLLSLGGSISQGQLETKPIAAKQLVRASILRETSPSNAFSSTFFAAVISAASSRTKPQQLHCQVAEAAA